MAEESSRPGKLPPENIETNVATRSIETGGGSEAIVIATDFFNNIEAIEKEENELPLDWAERSIEVWKTVGRNNKVTMNSS